MEELPWGLLASCLAMGAGDGILVFIRAQDLSISMLRLLTEWLLTWVGSISLLAILSGTQICQDYMYLMGACHSLYGALMIAYRSVMEYYSEDRE